MQIRDRIKELRRVRASELRPNRRNWRTHPQAQRDALQGVLAEVGYADALLVRELPDGTLELIDGHLRAETTPDMEVPVLILDLDDAEAAKLLALHDPLAGMAEANDEMLAELIADVETENAAVQALLERMIHEPELPAEEKFNEAEPREVDVPEAFQVVVQCRDEADQQSIYERLSGEGYKCKLLTL
jgi:ParB-like chromosome segregation protein Spo0J